MLTGATVTACGALDVPERTLYATAFELREVDGMSAYLGLLYERASGWSLVPTTVGRVPVPLTGATELLVQGETEMVWVAGRWEEGLFEVLSFGVLKGWER